MRLNPNPDSLPRLKPTATGLFASLVAAGETGSWFNKTTYLSNDEGIKLA